MTTRPCLACGVLTDHTRCAACARAYARAHASPHNPARDPRAIRRLHHRVVREWVQTHGPLCPGWQREAHQSYDLTADHVVPLAAGGRDTLDNLQALCRSCNGRKSASVGDGWRGSPCGPTPCLPEAAVPATPTKAP